MGGLYTRRIQADPLDASAYARRAGYYDSLHNRTEANADMRRWSAIVNHGTSVGWGLGRARTLVRSINGPFGYQLVVFLERQEDGMQQLHVAFGQKGGCKMKVFQVPMLAMSLVGLGLLSGLAAPPARADFTFGEPVNIQSDFPFLDTATEWIKCFSADGLEVYFESLGGRPGGCGKLDLWVCKRASVEDDWGAPENLGPLVNSSDVDMDTCISADGLELYFHSTRPGGYGQGDLYVTRRATRTSPWEAATNLGPKVNSSQDEFFPAVSPDGLELYFNSSRPGGYGSYDFYVSKRATPNDPWGDPVNVGPAVNSPGMDAWASLSPDGLLMFFTSDRPGGLGPWGDGYVARRASRSAPWQPAVNLGPIVNATPWNEPKVSADGTTLYIICDPNDSMTYWTYKAPILPVVDFNADGKVDLDDLRLLIDNWGTDKTLYDIGPFAWGDGKVDIEDLKAFTAEWEKQNPPKQP
jgi:hypothetical protein